MSDDNPRTLIRQAQQLPFGSNRTATAEAALHAAERSGDAAAALEARVELVACYRYGGEPAKVFETFDRCAADYDSAPERYDPWFDYSLRWDYKWLISLVLSHPDVGLDQAYLALDGMEMRYESGGHSRQAVYQYRCSVARHIGDVPAADRWYARWLDAPRDENSDCEGCEPTSRVEYLSWLGRDEEAIEVADPVLSGDLICREQPHSILTALLLPYLRMGHADAAREAHRRAHRVLRGRQQRLSMVATHVEFCARSGNERYGLDLVEEHLGRWENAEPYDQMCFDAAAALLLERVGPTVSLPAGVQQAGGAAGVRERALQLAARFDARNGSSACTEQVQNVLVAAPLVSNLPLVGDARQGRALAVSRAATGDHAGSSATDGRGANVGDPVAASPTGGNRGAAVPELDLATAGADELLDVAEELWRQRRVSDAEPQLRQFDQLAAEGQVPILHEARRADLRGAELVTNRDEAGAGALWERAVRLYGEAGDEERRQQALGRLGSLRCQQPATMEQGITLVEESTEYLWDSASVAVRAAATLRLARSYLVVGRAADALEIADQAASLAERSGYAIDLADAMFIRAQVMAEDDTRLDEAVQLAESARRGYRDYDHTAGVWSCLLHGQLLARVSAPTHAVEDAWSEAITMAGADGELRARTHAARGRWRLDAGRPTEAVIDLTEAYAAFTLGVHDDDAALVSVDLARAYLVADQPADAAEIAEEALPKLLAISSTDRLAISRVIGAARFVLAGALARLGERESAAIQFEYMATAQEQDGNPAVAGTWREAAAEMLEQDERDAEAGQAFGRAAECFAQAGDLLGEARCRRREALSIGWRGEVDQALRLLDHARRQLNALPVERHRTRPVLHEAGWLSYAEARMLASLDRQADAVERAEDALARMRALAATLRQGGDPEDLEEAEEAVRMVAQWRDALAADLTSI